MGKQVKVGILGAGFMGQTHARNLSKIPGVEVAAVCALDGTEAVANACGNPGIKTYNDFNAMLNECRMDALYVCLPPFAHNGQVEAAAQKGIHIFVEKPIALDTKRAASMADAIKKAGVKSQVGYHMRFGAAFKELKRLIDDGTAGIPTLFDARYECNSLHAPWWRERAKCGGQVFEQVIHLYDMSMYLFGTPTAVAGYTSNLCHKDVPGYTIEDTSASVIRFESGALANISATNNAVPMEWNNPFTVVCQNLTAHFTNANKAEFILTNRETPERRLIDGNTDMYYEESLAFIAAIREEAENVCTIEDGFSSLRLVESVVVSSEQDGQLVKL